MNECIAAIITGVPTHKQAISVIRVSGHQAIEIIDSLFSRDIINSPSHTVWYGWIKEDGHLFDQVLLSVFRAPKTYTSDDTVEISCHGGVVSAQRILEHLLSKGVKLALPGEFTQRALISGRIDIIEAQAVQELIESRTDISHQLSINKLANNVSNELELLEEALLNIIAIIEVNIDYPEYDDIEQMTSSHAKDEIAILVEQMVALIEKAKQQQQLINGIQLAILGKPNVGKSSILNAFLNEDKAIVTDIEGTTRDLVEGEFVLEGVLIKLVDTAGIRQTEDIVEKIGIDKSKSMIDKADIILVVLDGSRPLDQDDINLLDATKDKERLIVINKNDLECTIDIEGLSISSSNIEPLKKALLDKFDIKTILESTLALNEFQVLKLQEASTYLKAAYESCQDDMPTDLIAIDLQECWLALRSLLRKEASTDLLDVLFSKFCLGK